MVVPPPTNTTATHTHTENITHTDELFGRGTQRDGEGRDREEPSAVQVIDDTRAEYGGAERSRNAEPASREVRAPRRKAGRTRAHIKIGTLNMRGFGDSRGGGVPEKWWKMNQLLRDERIAILAVQEAHLTPDRVEALNELFGATMRVWAYADDENPTGARGVAFAVNRRLVAVDDATIRGVWPGRAAILTVPWSGGKVLKVMNIYAPNDAKDNALFWEKLAEDRAQRKFPRPDMMLGDFNLVESSIDRLPPRTDHQEAVDRLGEFRNRLDLVDGLREREPQLRLYTYLQMSTGSQSRIDRIYLSRTLMKNANEWKVTGPGIRTDHRLVTVEIANVEAPYVGKGRWAIPPALLSDKRFLEDVHGLGMRLQGKLNEEHERTARMNPQTHYAQFKRELRDLARKRAKQCIPMLDRRIAGLTTDIARRVNEEQATDEMKTDVAIMQDKLTELELRRFGRARAAVAVNDWANGETITRYWTRLN
ncbi:DNase I-like protein, partial [Lentinus brumalis]